MSKLMSQEAVVLSAALTEYPALTVIQQYWCQSQATWARSQQQNGCLEYIFFHHLTEFWFQVLHKYIWQARPKSSVGVEVLEMFYSLSLQSREDHRSWWEQRSGESIYHTPSTTQRWLDVLREGNKRRISVWKHSRVIVFKTEWSLESPGRVIIMQISRLSKRFWYRCYRVRLEFIVKNKILS